MGKVWAIAVAALWLCKSIPAEACAPAPPEGAFVRVSGEDAIVAFDPTSGREDFIRRATFETAEKDFGFLVPTPTKPELSAAPDQLFDHLAGVVSPWLDFEDKYDEGFEPTMLCPMFFDRGDGGKPTAVPASVTVLEQKRVAGLDAAVLAADDTEALTKWLKDHGYATREALTKWLEPYVAKRWIVTAFKIAPPEGAGAEKFVATEAVRMSFTTDRPFFPYREPADQRENLPAAAKGAHRAFRVYVLMPDRASGALEESYVWPGVVKYARPASAAMLGPLPFALAPNAWLTSFEDTSSPRPGVTDLFFTASSDKREIVPPPLKVVHHRPLPVPLDALVVVTLGLGYVAHRIRKRRRAR